MSVANNQSVPVGVIEGFYGRPWTFEQRHKLVGWLKRFGLNTYCFAPKDDLNHRVLWRELLDEQTSAAFRKLIGDCTEHGVRFLYAFSPGWENHFNDQAAGAVSTALLADLKQRCRQLLDLGCDGFVVQFDDVPHLDQLDPQRLARHHSDVCNRLFQWLSEARAGVTLVICPPVYCGRMAGDPISKNPYLAELGETLDPGVQVFWTGPEIISRALSEEHLVEIGSVLKRSPLIWDNLHANDYDPGRVFLGPFTHRNPELTAHTAGILVNPNLQFETNFLPLWTLGHAMHDPGFDPEKLMRTAIYDWLPEWEGLSGVTFSAELIGQLVDCFYLPFEHGPFARDLMESARAALNGDSEARSVIREAADRFADLFHNLATLKNRDLLDALWSPVWRLKDELELIHQLASKPETGSHPLPDFPKGVVRGGLVRDLQQLTHQHPDGRFSRKS